MHLPHDEFLKFCSQKNRGLDQANIMLVKWIAPHEGYVKVNIDGRRDLALQRIGSGSFINKPNGELICGFVRFDGYREVLLVEL